MSTTPHIFTFTGNLLAEHTLEFDAWSPGGTQRARAEAFQVGGKGINVSKMLTRLGAANTALCFAGGDSGAVCETWLGAKSFSFRTFSTSRPTRRGNVVRDLSGAYRETTFFSPDVAPDAKAIRDCVDFLTAQPTGSVLAICGSLPGWDSIDFEPLRDLLRRWPERGSLVVDTYGPPLAWFVERAAALIRINRRELETLFTPAEQKLSSGELLLQLRDRSATLRWAVTDGPGPIWFVADHKDPEMIKGPVVREVSATGSGDVMLACTLHARFHRGLSWRDAVAWSLPYAAANAGHPGVAEFPDPIGE